MRSAVAAWVVALSSVLARSAAADEQFALHPAADVPVVVAPAVVALAPEVSRSSFDRPACAGRCDPARVPAFDRWVLGADSQAAGLASDVLLAAIPTGALALELADEHGTAFWPDAVVLLQAMSLGALAVELTKLVVRRTRPWAYAAARVPTEADASLSFFSGHTTVAFAAATAFAETYRRHHAGEAAVPIVWGASALLAAAVGALRLLAGKHFPSDVLVGAIVGTAFGILVPAAH